MSIGNQLYLSLSQLLARQSYLTQSKLLTMLNVFYANYQLHYSESYSGTVHQETTIQGFQYFSSSATSFWITDIWRLQKRNINSWVHSVLLLCIVNVTWGLEYLILIMCFYKYHQWIAWHNTLRVYIITLSR